MLLKNHERLRGRELPALGMGIVHRAARPGDRFRTADPPDHRGRYTPLHRRLYPHVQKH